MKYKSCKDDIYNTRNNRSTKAVHNTYINKCKNHNNLFTRTKIMKLRPNDSYNTDLRAKNI